MGWKCRSGRAIVMLATAAARCARETSVERVVICSPDKDLAQMVSGSTKVVLQK